MLSAQMFLEAYSMVDLHDIVHILVMCILIFHRVIKFTLWHCNLEISDQMFTVLMFTVIQETEKVFYRAVLY